MIPFRVQCETCQSWLKVRSESLVGQIRSCPKCGAMVQLVPSDAPGPTPHEKSAAAAVAVDQQASSKFDAVDQSGLDQPLASNAAPPEEAYPASPTESLGRKLALTIGGGGAALCLLGGVALFLMGSGEPEVAQAPPLVAEQPEELAQPAPAPISSEELVTEPSKPLPLEPEPTVQAPVAEPPVIPELPPAETSPPSAPAPAAAEKRQDVQDIDPLDFDPASLDLILLRGDVKPAKDPPRQESPPRGPAIGGPDEVLAAERDDVQQRVASLDNRLAKRAEEERIWVDRGVTAFEPHKPVDLARRLSDRVPELVLAGAPLAQAVRLWSDLAGVPVTIDPQALARAGVSPRAKITLSGSDATLGELLLAGLKPVRLTYTEQQGQLVLARLGGRQLRTAGVEVADLLRPAEEQDDLDLVSMAAALAPHDTQELALEDDNLTLTASAAAHLDLAIFCERLRRARRLSQQTKYPPSLLAVRPALAKLAPALRREVTFSFITPTPLTDIFEHWRRALGVEVLVDWGSVAKAKLGPRSLVRCSVRDQPWRAALDGVLQPLGLGWRAINGRTIQIVSRADAEQGQLSLEFYPLASARGGRESSERLVQLAAGLQPRPVVYYDAPSNALLVRASGASHWFVYEWLLANGLIGK